MLKLTEMSINGKAKLTLGTMTTIILDGKKLAKSIEKELSKEVQVLTGVLGRPPCLAVLLVGEDAASKVYVGAKSRHAEECGIQPRDIRLPSDVSNDALQKLLNELSADHSVDGILLQLPLPKHLSEFGALQAIAPGKDVDGLHPYNQGLLLRGETGLRPCTPLGVMRLIESARARLNASPDISGLSAVVIGRSVLVGKPVGMLLLEQNCTVSIAHSKTRNLPEVCQSADILVAAVGRPKLITKDFIKPGAIVIDVGINRLSDGTLAGDVDFESAVQVAGAISPVPGGVGPMTIAMLLRNTVLAGTLRLPS